ncbi:MAG: dienelactone hydrolase family protein, partial [Rickettsiales bacterium]|nr:dienelactone hydrolase family protein [Rickettsiales bacterium]
YENEDPAYAAAGGLQWFSLEQFRPWEEAIMHDDTAAREDDEVFAYIEKSIKEIAELCGMAPENTILLGFSQGAVIASGYAHYSGRKAMGVIALSGLAAFCAKRMKRKTPILVMHGTKDEVVPFTLYEKVKASLTAAEVPAEFAPIQGLGHAINKEEIAKGAVFIKKLLKRLS